MLDWLTRLHRLKPESVGAFPNDLCLEEITTEITCDSRWDSLGAFATRLQQLLGLKQKWLSLVAFAAESAQMLGLMQTAKQKLVVRGPGPLRRSCAALALRWLQTTSQGVEA